MGAVVRSGADTEAARLPDGGASTIDVDAIPPISAGKSLANRSSFAPHAALVALTWHQPERTR